MVGIHGNTNRCRYINCVSIEVEWLFEAADEFGGDDARVIVLKKIGKYDGKLVAPLTRQGIAFPQAAFEAVCYLL